MSLDCRVIQQKIEEKFAGQIVHADLEVTDPFLVIEKDAVVEIAVYLRDDPDLAFDTLHCLSAVDYTESQDSENPRIEVVLHLTSLKHRHWIVLKVQLPRLNPQMSTLENVWPTSNWHEREAYDLFGIEFEGHSDLRRILLPDDWPGHPMLKDWDWPDEWHGIAVKPTEKMADRAQRGEQIGTGPFD